MPRTRDLPHQPAALKFHHKPIRLNSALAMMR
jgi:hypothetical protein